MQHIDVPLDDHEFEQAASRAQEAGVSLETWVRDLIRHAAVPAYPTDPLFGLLADAPDLADAIDLVVAERDSRRLRGS
ncbi:MAG TPA: hypothetical protein VHB98_11255 [Chloroflexota bacterium]|jgi:hypothetical protein|nr:hypothetical protein [Chloroflexota bacterium]